CRGSSHGCRPDDPRGSTDGHAAHCQRLRPVSLSLPTSNSPIRKEEQLEEKLRTSLLRQSASHRTALASRLACPIPLPWHPATGLGVCASCLSCLLVLISPFYEHRPYRTATAAT